MAVISACPNDSVLQQLALGKMPPEEVEHLGRHCEQCPNCIRRLQALKTDDTLIEALASQSTESNPIVDALIERLKRTPPPTPESEMTATVAGGDTPSGEAAGDDFVEKTQAGDPSLAPPQSTDEIGRLGGYRVQKMLGAGGMGMVYQAEDMHLQRPIALKVMKAELSKNPGNRERFLREARAAAKLKSDHVVTIHQVSEERQIVFLAMEYLEGMSLDDWLKMGRKPTMAQAARIGRQIALGLADAHACGLIHRDIKPGNIWLDSRHQGRVKLLDFGLARGDKEDVQLTQSGAIVGTPAYMAPEQARGEKVDHRADLFSLGVVLYRLTTGRLPFQGDNTMSLLTSLALDHPKPPREINADISPRMATLIERLLTKDREQRPATAKVVADELAVIEREATQPATDDRTVQIKQAASASARFPQPAPSRSRLRWLIAASLLFLFGGLAAGIVVIIRDKQGKEVARVNVPEGGSATVESEEKGKPPDKDKKQASAIPADPLLKIEPGTPLGPLALVTNPAPLPGVRSWTIETRMPRSVINAVAHRPDGLLLATAGDDGVIRLLDPKSGQMVHALVGHKARITLLAWSPDGRTLASGSWDGTVRLWDADSGRWLRTLKGLEQPWAIAWSPDGRSIMGCQNPNVLTWDAATGKTISTATLSKVVTRPAFSPDGKFMAGESEDHLVRIWDVRTGREVRTLKGHTATLYNIAWSPDGKRLASTGEDAVRLWETETGKELRKHSSPNGYYGMLAWSPDGRTLALDAAIGHHAQLDLMQVDNSVPLRTIHACNNPVGISWSPDGKTVASGGSYGDVAITDLESGAKTELYPGSANSFLTGLAWGPDSKQLATTTYQAGTRVVNSTTGEATATLTDAQAVVAWSPGKWLAASGPEAQLTLWQPRGGKRIFPAHKVGYVGSLAWSPDGKTLADAGRQSGTLRLWDGETQQLQRQWDAGKDIDILSWSPDGKLLAAGFGTGQQRQVKFWHADTGKEMRTLPGFEGVKWSSTAETLAVYYNNHLNVRLFNVKTGELGLTLSSGGVQNVAWSPDGKLLAAACTGNEGESGPLFIPVWDVATGEEVRKLDCVCLRGSINPLAWSPDGKRIAACAAQTIQLWEAETGKPDGVILPNPQYHGLTIRPDGHYRGDAKVNDAIVMVVQKADGTTETLTPHEFERKYGFKNEPDKVRLLEK